MDKKQKSFEEDTKQKSESEPILSKYKAPSTKADKQIAEEEEERKKRVLKEKQRMQGKVIPSRGDEQHERNLVLIATKGVVTLFNTVSEY